MKDFMKNLIGTILMIITILCWIICFSFIPYSIYEFMKEVNSNEIETEMYVDVVDKYTKTGLVGKTPITRYFTQVKIKGIELLPLTQ